MHAKFFHRLPAALHRYVDTFLNSSDASHLAQTSSNFHALSNQAPLAIEQRKPLNKFLGHVVHGEREPMQEMLQQNNQLMLQRDTVTDYSGRTFDSISGFEYALWALDKHLWDDMLAFLPRDEQSHLTEDGRELVKQLLRQLEQVKDQQISYMLNGQSIKESHYDFAIIDALREYVTAYNVCWMINRETPEKQWCEGVGGAQRLLPLHVVDEYCSNTSFYPVPQFDSRPRLANGLRQFNNQQLSADKEFWFGIHSKLGIEFALYKWRWMETRMWREEFPAQQLVAVDLEAMEALYDTRTKDFTLLEAQLSSLLDVEEQPCPCGM